MRGIQPGQMQALIDHAARILAESGRVAILTGAGMSAESGVPTFRGSQGLWRRFRPEELATPEAFARDPRLVWEWYAWRQGLVAGCQPNAGHLALARLEREGPSVTLITQNVDGLHSRAGSTRVLELHGDLFQARCVAEGTVRDFQAADDLPPHCSCGALLRPHIVWFGESLDARVVEKAVTAVEECQVLLVVGTSALVTPAAVLPVMARRSGAEVIEVNPETTAASELAVVAIRGPAARVLPLLVEQALSLRTR